MAKIQSNQNIMSLREMYREGDLFIDHQSACVYCNYIPVLEKMYTFIEELGIDESKVVRYIKNICKVLNKIYLSRSPSIILGTALWFSGEVNQIRSAKLTGTTTQSLRKMKRTLRYWYYFWREEGVQS